MAALCSPAENLDCVATSNTAAYVLINTTLVVEEVFVYGECTFKRTVSVKLGFNFINRLWVDNGSSFAFIFQPFLPFNAFSSTRRFFA